MSKLTYARAVDYRAMHISYLIACERMTEEQAVRAADMHARYEELLGRTLARKCATEGHRIVDNSYGGPDSGCIDLECRRCGWSHHVTLY